MQNTRPNLPNFLITAGQTVANRPVSESRVYISLVILGISAVIAGSMLYAGIRSSIISIGRNPLSKRSIIRSLIQVTLTSLIVFIIGLFAVYLLLRV
jgi:multisubunit Na+/H+ antiporter MnhB subunit